MGKNASGSYLHTPLLQQLARVFVFTFFIIASSTRPVASMPSPIVRTLSKFNHCFKFKPSGNVCGIAALVTINFGATDFIVHVMVGVAVNPEANSARLD